MPATTLKPGLLHEFRYRVPAERTVPYVYPESDEFRPMPQVFATAYLVGLLEWTCARLVIPHLDWPAEQTVGTHVSISHEAPTPPGLTVTASVELVAVDGRRLEFDVRAYDGIDLIARGTHQRVIIDTDRFSRKAAAKAAQAIPGGVAD
ncbi:MAG: thioesterase family protein [Microbispora sp.]|nr:thioesterase family protein [Microbispora sp.]